MQNWFATFALLAWPVVGILLFALRPPGEATVLTILGALLLLPVNAAIKFEGIPQFDKTTIPNLAALVGVVLFARRPLKFWNGFGIAEVLVVMFLVGPFVTSELNGDVFFAGDRFIPSVGHYDALSAAAAQFLFLLPFFLGRQILRSAADTETVLRILVLAGLVYSMPMLFEVRMSPQLHYWLYGYFPGSFAQQIRDGGFRPVVFMGHGLWVAFFAMTAVVASAAFWRTDTKLIRIAPFWITTYLSVILVVCKTFGALIYGMVLVPLVRWARPAFQLRIAVVFASIALSYPLLRATGIVPAESMVSLASVISQDRGDSLKVRFDQEKMLLEHASSRIWFGWGRWGRSRVYEEETGKDISVTDGHWVITIGVFGIFGFLAEFGLLALPVFRAMTSLRFAERNRDRIFLSALGLICAVNMIDLLPNASISSWTWLLAGSLLGRAEALRSIASQQRFVQRTTYPTRKLETRGAELAANDKIRITE